MAILDKINAINKELDKMKKKLAIPLSSSLAEITDAIGTANMQNKSVNPDTKSINVTPDEGFIGLNKVTVNPIKAAFIKDLKPDIIKKGERVLEMTGTYGPSSQIKTINPSIHLQEIEPDANFEFISKLYVNPVTRSIDSDIRPENIKKNVEILGVIGTYNGNFRTEEKTVSASKHGAVTIEPSAGINGLSRVTVNKVTSSIDSNLKPENIKKDIEILDIIGTYVPAPTMSNKVITPTVNEREYYPDAGYDAFKKVTVKAISPALDSNLNRHNIRENVTIFGVTGSLIPLRGTDLTIEPSIEPQEFKLEPTDKLNGYNKVIVNPVTASIDPNILPGMIKLNQEILGVRGTYTGEEINIQPNKDVISGDEPQEILPDMGFDAMGAVTVLPVPTKDIMVNASYTDVTVEKPDGAYIKKVTVPAVTAAVDQNIQPENIKQNIEILGVIGTYTGKQQTCFYPISPGTGDIFSTQFVPGVYNALIDLPDGCSFASSDASNTFSKSKIIKIPNIDFSNVTNLNYTFYECTSIRDFSNLRNLNNVKTAYSSFVRVKSPNSILNLDFPNVEALGSTFTGAELAELNIKISSKCTSLSSCCSSSKIKTIRIDADEVVTPNMSQFISSPNSGYLNILELSDNIRPTSMKEFAKGGQQTSNGLYTRLENFSFNASELVDASYMFQYEFGIKSIELRGESRKVTTFEYAFSTSCMQYYWTSEGSATALHTIKNLYFDSCSNIQGIFGRDTSLQNVEGFYNLGMAYTAQSEHFYLYTLGLSLCTALTRDSLVNIFNGLYDLNISYKVAEGGTLYRQQIILNKAHLDLLTDDEIAMAREKGWDVTT